MTIGKTPKHRVRTIEEIRRIIRSNMDVLKERYGVLSLELFGSYVRGEQKKGSDIDILVEFDPTRPLGLYSIIALEQELTDLLGVRVDLVEKNSLKPRLRNRIISEAVPP